MLSLKYSHQKYQSFVRDFLNEYFIRWGQNRIIWTLAPLIIKLWISDLTNIVFLVRDRYSSSNKGTPPKDVVALLRSLILMTLSGETSITKWVETLQTNPFYAILSGFIPADYLNSHPDANLDEIPADTLPGIGTFYDFMDRLIRKDKLLYKSNIRKRRRKPKNKQKKNQKYDSSKPGVVNRLVNRVIKYSDKPLLDTPESILNKILKEIFVVPSVSMGILGDTDKFNIAGDTTCMPTHASHYGKKICDCKLERGQSCDCNRKFLDPSASWGWDSYKEQWFYGHAFHCFSACNSSYDLPIHLKCVTGERHDSVTGVYALTELIQLYPEFDFYSAAFDSGYDSNYFYLLNNHFNIIPVIELNERASKPDSRSDLYYFDKNGIPHGTACGHSFRNWGLMKKSFRRKWLYPVQCDNCSKCPAKSNWCKYTPILENPRYFTPILRGSKQWKNLYKRRTTTERIWDRINNDFNAENAVVFSRERRTVRVFLGAFCCYIDAWFKESSLTIRDIFPNLPRLAA
ncbi:MAG: hypothetical protein PWQ82_1568 [Thermosediminibacterales bacterium]|nr:hypothetical protein [Thermosediminibacterales bacterium]MDK2835795.1 hypothetical protein [Thermosediminibacterales bacterium]